MSWVIRQNHGAHALYAWGGGWTGNFKAAASFLTYRDARAFADANGISGDIVGCEDAQQEYLIRKTLDLMGEVDRAGFVVTIETVPQKPLAMGKYFMACSVRPARERAK